MSTSRLFEIPSTLPAWQQLCEALTVADDDVHRSLDGEAVVVRGAGRALRLSFSAITASVAPELQYAEYAPEPFVRGNVAGVPHLAREIGWALGLESEIDQLPEPADPVAYLLARASADR